MDPVTLVLVIFVVLAVLQSQAALTLSYLAYRKTKETPVSFQEFYEPTAEELDELTAEKLKRKAASMKQTEETWDAHRRAFEELTNA